MITTSEQAIFDEIAINNLHCSKAPDAFFQAWKRGVELVGLGLFGECTRECLDLSVDKLDLCPNVAAIRKAIGVMSSGEKILSRRYGELLRRRGRRRAAHASRLHGLADLGGLDLERRQIIAKLILNYTGG